MEQSKPGIEQNGQSGVQEHGPKSDPKDSGHVTNGDEKAGIGTEPSGSEAVSDSQTEADQSMGRTASSGSTKKSVRWSSELVTETTFEPSPQASHQYAYSSPMSQSSFSVKDTVDTVRNVLGRWGRKMGEATRKAENLADSTWQHLKTSPSFAEAAMGRIAQGTKVLAEGGYEKIFRQTFETVPEEQLQNCFACYLSTSAGPVMGVLYISTAKLAYCSDSPLSYKNGGQTEWSYYKVVIPLHQLKAVNPSSSRANPAQKYIQMISVDNHEFWFMGFLNYEGAANCLQEAFQANKVEIP